MCQIYHGQGSGLRRCQDGFRSGAPAQALSTSFAPTLNFVRTMSFSEDFNHDHARPDASAQGLAQVEPGAGRAGVHRLLHSADFLHDRRPSASARRRAKSIAEVDGRKLTAGEFQQRYLPQIQAYRTQYGGNINEQLLRQLGIEQQILQQMVDEQAALDRGGAPRHSRQRRGARAADLLDSRAAGERPVHRRAALRAAAAQPASADDEGRRSRTACGAA